MKFKPLHSQVLIRPTAIVEKTQSGLIIPETSRGKATTGEVVAVGDGGNDNSPMTVKIGDKVMLAYNYAGLTTVIEEEELIITDESQILGIIT